MASIGFPLVAWERTLLDWRSVLSHPFEGICDEFHCNMRLGSQLPLAQGRETVLKFFEMIQNFAFLPSPWTLATEELSVSGRINRRKIIEKNQILIASLYEPRGFPS